MASARFREIQDEASGLTFRFAYDKLDPSVLHLTAAHGVTTSDAIRTFFEGAAHWNERRRLFETETIRHLVAWLPMSDDGRRILVVTCLRQEERTS